MSKIKNTEGETWKPVVGYEGLYEISNKGRVKSLPRNTLPREMFPKLHKGHGGYVTVVLFKDGHHVRHSVHVLVMESFANYYNPSKNREIQIDHLNGVRDDNRLENLEIVTASENVKRTFIRGRKAPYMRKVICLDTNDIFESVTEAAESVGVTRTSILAVCKGVLKTCRGLRFAFYDDYKNGTIPPFTGQKLKGECKICGKPVFCRGLCNKHYTRYLRHGNPYMCNGKIKND